MKKPSRILMITLVLLAGIGLTSCELFGGSDNPTPTPTPKPTPTPAPTYASDAVRPLTFEATKDGVTVMLKFSDNAKPDYRKVEYSLDGGATWTALSGPAQPILLEKAGDIVMFRGDNPTYNGDARFIVEQATSQARSNTRRLDDVEALCNLYGTLGSMINSRNLTGAEVLIEDNLGAFKELFKDAHITTLDKSEHILKLPSIGMAVLVPEAFKSLFEGSLITTAPEVTVGTVAEGTIVKMFKDCPYLKKASFELGGLAEGVTVEQGMGDILGGTTGSKTDGGELKIEWNSADYIPLSNSTISWMKSLTLDDLMNVSGLSTEVLGNTKVSVVDATGKASEADNYEAVTGVEIIGSTSQLKSNGYLVLTVGDDYGVIADVVPHTASDRSTEWSSDDPAIAIWDPEWGIRALSPGETLIWVAHGSIKASIRVIVNAKPDPVKDPSVNDPDDYGDGGDPTAASN